MLSITLQIIMVVGFIALTVLIWRVSRRPNWRVRTVVYGWAAVFLYALLCAVVLPLSLKEVMDAETQVHTFPDGTLAAGALFGGWIWPLIVVALSRDREKISRKK